MTLTITDSVGNTQTITAVVQADGSFSAEVPTELAEGEFTVDASVTDGVGNTAIDSTTGDIDLTAPTISLDAVATTNDNTPILSGTTDATPGSVVTLTITDSDGNTQTITAVVQADGTFSAEVPTELAEGEFTVDASVTDEAGNTAIDSTTGEVDLTAPSIALDAIATTNDTTPLLSGTTDATPGSVVTLTITDSAGNTQTITAVVQADGTFSAEVPADLAEGEFTVDASVTDEAGNTATDSIASVVDTTAPTITLSDPGSNGDATPTISGFTDAAPGSVVSFTVTDSAGNTQTFTALVNDDGTFSVEVPADVAPGVYDVTASVSDAAGNTVTATANGNYDTTAPSTTVNQPAPSNDTTPNISGETTAPAGSTVVIVVTDSEGNEQTLTTTVNADGSFDADIPVELAEGEYTVNVTVTDPSGNSSSNTVTGIIDTTPPTLSLDAIGTTNDNTPLIQGETDAGTGATVTIQLVHSDGTIINLTATVQEDGSFSVEVPQELADGDFSVTATVSDQAGNTTSTSINAAINADGPNVVVQPQPVTDGDDVFNGSSDTPNSEVVVTITDSEGNSQTITVPTDENGDFSFEIPDGLVDGEITVEVTATDDDGDTSTTTTTTTLDTTPPVVELDPLTSGNDTTPTISGSTDLEEGSTVTLVVTDNDGVTQTLTATVDADGNFSVEVPNALADGDYTVEATATDDAGNTATDSATGNINSAAPTITLDAQGLDNDATPLISGTSDVTPGTTVTLTVVDADGNTQIFQAIVQGDGTFSAEVPNALSEGDYTVTATVTDGSGNSATAVDTGGSVDTQAPAISLDTLGDSNDATPLISGTTDLPAGATVTIVVTDSAGNEQTLTAIVDNNGNFSVEATTPLAEGAFTVEATATDAAGNSTTANENGGNIDTTSPTISLTPLGTSNDATPTLSGTTDMPEGSVVTLSVTDSDGNIQTFTATVDASGNFSADVPNDLSEGDYTVTASVTDNAGNTATDSETGSFDANAPTLTLDAQEVGNDDTPSISGNTDLPVGTDITITITDSAGNTQTIITTVNADGSFSVDALTPLSEGAYSVTATGTDASGNTASASSSSGVIDTIPPSISLDALGASNDNTPTISGSTDLAAGNEVTLTITDSAGNIQVITATVDADGNFSVDVPTPLADGNYTVSAEATDAAGNTASATQSGSIDTTAPSLTIAPQGEGNDSTPTISGTTDLPAGSTISITVTDDAGNVQVFNATVDASGNFSADVPTALVDGPYTVEVVATDSDGNTTTVADGNGVIDTTPPTLTLTPLNTDNDPTPTISGTTDLPEGATVTLTVTDSAGNVQTLIATVDAAGNFSVEVPTALAEGDFDVVATATDSVGNSTTVTETGGSVDTTSPVITLDPQGTGNDSTPIISGSTDLAPGSTVSITVTDSAGATQTFNATVASDGSFSVEVPAALADGNYTVTANAIDEAGNTASDSVSGTINSAAPSLTIDALGADNDTTPTISGTTDLPAGSTVSIVVTDSAGNTQNLIATVQADGSYSIEVGTPLAEGAYTVTATATDGAGNTATVTENGGIVDTIPPAITVDAQALTNDATPTISGATDLPQGSTVSITVVDNAGNAQTFTAVVGADGSYSADVPADLAEGAYTVTVTATDEAGNTATANDNDGVVDTLAPALTVDAQGLTNDDTPLISGTTDLPQGSTVTIVVTDSNNISHTFTATVANDGSYQAEVPTALAEGSYTVTVTATDDAGNTVQVSNNDGVVDTIAPVISLTPVSSGNDDTPTLSGTTDLPQGSIVTLVVTDANGNTQTLNATVNNDGTFSVEVPSALADGNYTVTASATDAAGNATTVSDSGTINTSAPNIDIDPLGQTNDPTPLISGTTDAPVGSTVTLTVTDSAGNVQTFTATVQANGTFSASVPADLAEGAYTVEAEVADGSGNVGTDTETGGVVDTTSPAVDVADPGLGNDATPLITGTTDQPAGSTVSITVTDSAGNVQNLTATVQLDGSFSVEVPVDLAEGSYTVEAQVTDLAGNTASDTENGTLDVTAPVISVNDPGTGNDTTPTITGSTDLPTGSSVQITVVDNAGVTQVFTAIVAANGTFSADVPAAMAEGSFTVSVSATDDAGNTATDADTGVIDVTAPTITVDVDDVTNDTTPVINGTTDAAAGTTVTITVTDSNGAVQTLSAIVQANGTYSVEVPTALAEGNFTVSATVSDSAGNSATATDTGEVDTTPPAIVIDPIDLTSDPTPTITGSTDVSVGTIVLVTVTSSTGIEQTIAAVVQVDGSWSVDVPLPLADGNFTVSAQVLDEAGNIINASINAEVDTTAPIISIDQNGVINVATPEISGSVDLEEGTEILVTITDSNGDTQILTAIVDEFGDFSVVVPDALAEGLLTIQVDATDPAGNSSVETTILELDLTASSITLDLTADVVSDLPVVSGVTDAIAGTPVTIVISQNGSEVVTINTVVLPDGTFSGTVPITLNEGTATIEVTVDDGVVSTVTTDVEIDVTAPLLTIDALGAVNDLTPVISGTSDEIGATVTITVVGSDSSTQTLSATVQSDGTYSIAVPSDLPEGAVTITAEITDEAGNTTSVSVLGDIDITPPSITVDITDLDSLRPTISGLSEAGTTVTIVLTDSAGNETTLTTTVQGDGTYSITVPSDLPQGLLSVDVSVLDDAGNLATVTTSGIVDVSLPVINLDALVLDTLRPTITGISERVGSEVTITLTDGNGGNYTLTAIVQNDGTFTVDVPTDLAQGLLNVQAEVLDADGNLATVSTSGILDLTIPVLNINSLTLDSLTPTITGMSERIGETVTVVVTDGNGVVQNLTAVVQNNGFFTVTVPSDLSEGLIDVDVSVLGSDGNVVTVSTSGVLDLTLPVLQLDTLTLDSLTPTITGVSERIGETVTLVLTDSSGAVQTLTAVVQNNGVFSITVPSDLAQGLLDIDASVLGSDGNLVTLNTSGIVDFNLPVLQLNAIDGSTLTPIISGISERIGSTVELTLTEPDGSTTTVSVTVQDDGTFSYQVPIDLQQGLLSVQASVLDADNNLVTADVTGIINVSLSELSIDALNFNSATPTITGVSEYIGETISLLITDGTGATQTVTGIVANDGTFSIPVTANLADGLLTVDATILDSGNNALANITTTGLIDVDLDVLSLNSLDFNSATPTITGESEFIGETISLLITDGTGATQTVTGIVANDGTFSIPVTANLADGLLTVDATILDSGNNVLANITTTGLIDVDLDVLSLNSLDFNSATPTITGESEFIGETISLLITDGTGATQTVTGIVANDGTFSIPVTANLADGLLTVDATILDSGNNALANITTTGLIDVDLDVLSIDSLSFENAIPTITGESENVGDLIRITVTDRLGNTETITSTVGNDGTFSIDFAQAFVDGLLTVDAEIIDVNDGTTSIATLNTDGVMSVNLTTLELDPIDGSSLTPTISGTSDRIGEVVSFTLTDALGNVYNETATVQNDGTFSVVPAAPVKVGDLVVSASVSDGSGGTETTSLTQLINVPPNIQITELDTGILGSEILRGTVGPEFEGFELTVTLTAELLGVQVGLPIIKTALVQSDGSFEIASLGLSLGALATVTIEVAMTDAAGNLVTLTQEYDSNGDEVTGTGSSGSISLFEDSLFGDFTNDNTGISDAPIQPEDSITIPNDDFAFSIVGASGPIGGGSVVPSSSQVSNEDIAGQSGSSAFTVMALGASLISPLPVDDTITLPEDDAARSNENTVSSSTRNGETAGFVTERTNIEDTGRASNVSPIAVDATVTLPPMDTITLPENDETIVTVSETGLVDESIDSELTTESSRYVEITPLNEGTVSPTIPESRITLPGEDAIGGAVDTGGAEESNTAGDEPISEIVLQPSRTEILQPLSDGEVSPTLPDDSVPIIGMPDDIITLPEDDTLRSDESTNTSSIVINQADINSINDTGRVSNVAPIAIDATVTLPPMDTITLPENDETIVTVSETGLVDESNDNMLITETGRSVEITPLNEGTVSPTTPESRITLPGEDAIGGAVGTGGVEENNTAGDEPISEIVLQPGNKETLQPLSDGDVTPILPDDTIPVIGMPDDTITLPGSDDIATEDSSMVVTFEQVDLELPPEELIIPTLEDDLGSQEDMTVDNNGSETSVDESGDSTISNSPTDSEILQTVIDKLPPTDI